MPSYSDQHRNYTRPHSQGNTNRTPRLRTTSSSAEASQGMRRGYRSAQVGSEARRNPSRSYRSRRPNRNATSHDSGFSVRQRGINFLGRKGGLLAQLDQRSLLILAGALIALLLLVFAVSSCVRSCSSASPKDAGSDTSVNAQDFRVAASASPDVTSKLTSALDSADGLYKIAKNADKYSDSRLVDLAVQEPAAIQFVLSYPDADHTSKGYEDSLEKGSYPLLFDWDSRWGNVDFGDGALAVTGSGPTSLAMAYMGLTGKTDQTPATIAKAITDAGADKAEGNLDKSFIEKHLTSVGLSANAMEVGKDNLHAIVDNGAPALVQVKADTLTSNLHWILVIGYSNDGALVVYDPSSSAVSSHSWDAGTIAASANALYAIGIGTPTNTSSDNTNSDASATGASADGTDTSMGDSYSEDQSDSYSGEDSYSTDESGM